MSSTAEQKQAEKTCSLPATPVVKINDSGPGATENSAKTGRNTANAANAAENPEKENVLPRYYYTQKEFWGGTTLSYTIYTVLALIPISGFLGLDHMYMRSPGTGFMKFIMNFFTLGYWYFYDVIQAVTDQEDVRTFGVSMPLYGPSGIGAGSFGSEEEPVTDKNGSAGNFLWFTFASLFLPFGIEYLIAGDIGGFLCKFVGTLFFIGLIYGLINNMKLLNHPERVLCEGLPRFAPFTWFDVEERFENTAFRNKLGDNCPPAEGAVGGWFSGIFGNLVTKVPGLAEIYQTFIGVKDAAKQVTRQTAQALGTAKNLAGKAVAVSGKITELQAAAAGAGSASSVLGSIAGPAAGAAGAAPTAAPTAPAADNRPGIPLTPGATMTGGGSVDSSSNTILTFTFALVFLGAIFLKGKDSIIALSNKSDRKMPALGNYVIRNKNEPALPPESGVF